MEWISVKDRLPEEVPFDMDNLHVLVFEEKTNRRGVGFYDHGDEQWYYNLNGYNESSGNDVTHWMPFPDVPKI